MLKKILSILLLTAMLLPTVACGKTTPSDTDGTSATESSVDQPDVPEASYLTLSKSDYTEKTTSGFLAQLVGFLSGYEFARDSSGNPQLAMPDSWFEMCNGPYAEPNKHNKHEDKLLYNEGSKLWEVWNDDDFSIDILNQYILRDMYEQYGTVTQKVITEDWVNYDVYDMGGGHRTTGAYGIYKSLGYLPDFAGSAEYGNTYTVNGEPYIENETLGMVTAGMPVTAASLSEVFANVTSDQDPVLWAKLFATMYSLAYFRTDVSALIREAAQILPDGCVQREVIDEVFALKEKYGTDWRRAVVAADKQCYRKHYGADSKMGETSINCAFILIGLLFGEGDYYNTCKIISLAGHGGDSTTPVGLGIVAIMNGMKDLPKEVNEKVWQDGNGIIVNRPIPDTKTGYWMCAMKLPERMKIADIVEMYRENFEHVLLENGGKIEGDTYYIPEQTLGKTDTVLYENFESGKTDGWQTAGSVAVTDDAFMGKYGLKLSGTEDGTETVAYTTLENLTVGKQYRVVLYALTATRTEATVFVREPGKEDSATASVYNASVFYRRTFVFTANAEKTELGIRLASGTASHKYALIDDICVTRVEETPVAEISLSAPSSDGIYTGKITFNEKGKVSGEAYLRIVFENSAAKCVSAAVSVNGEDFKNAPFYCTGPNAKKVGADVIYIPILLPEDENTVTLDIGKNSLTVRSVSVVKVNDLF